MFSENLDFQPLKRGKSCFVTGLTWYSLYVLQTFPQILLKLDMRHFWQYAFNYSPFEIFLMYLNERNLVYYIMESTSGLQPGVCIPRVYAKTSYDYVKLKNKLLTNTEQSGPDLGLATGDMDLNYTRVTLGVTKLKRNYVQKKVEYHRSAPFAIMFIYTGLFCNNVHLYGAVLDKRLTWHKHIFTKRKHLGITLTKLYWLIGSRSKLSLSNKLLISHQTYLDIRHPTVGRSLHLQC
jgi:hypothetical protein